MVAAPQYATLVISNGVSNINIDVYLSDVANAAANFDSGAGAASTSETFYKSPVSGRIVDFAVKTGLTDTTKGRVTINNSPTKSVIRWANHENTLNNRPMLNIPVAAGENIGIVQLA
jgi:hypothetical protein